MSNHPSQNKSAALGRKTSSKPTKPLIHAQISDYLKYCEQTRGMSPTTMHAKRNICHRFAAVTHISNLQHLDNPTFNAWLQHELARGVAHQSLNTYNSTIFSLVHYHRELGAQIPLQLQLLGKLKSSTRPRRTFFTAAEIRRATQFADPETALMIRIMFETGLRIAELTHLRLANLDGREIRFIGKGRKPREVYLTEPTAAALAAYILEHHKTDYIWGCEPGRSHLPPTVETVRQHLGRPFAAAGFRGFYPHALRHSFATDLQLRGASVAEIKEMLGHESIATTERYLHGFDGKLRELFDKYR